MKTPFCSQCGREVVVQNHPVRNKKSFPGYRAQKDHDLCRQCYRSLMMRVRISKQQEAV